MAINTRRVRQGAPVGGVVFFLWSLITEFVIAPGIVGSDRLAAASRAGFLLEQGRIPLGLFLLAWFAGLWVVSYGAAWAYGRPTAPDRRRQRNSACWWDSPPGSRSTSPTPSSRVSRRCSGSRG
jgi:hypothetical protein